MAASAPGDRSVRPGVVLRAIGPWLAMAVLAVLNGGLREAVLIPRVGEYPGHVLSTLALVVLVLAVAAAYFGWTDRRHTRAELAVIGVGWTVLTVGFEFLVGYVEGTPVETTIGQYDVFAGQVWILVPLALLVSPSLFGYVLER